MAWAALLSLLLQSAGALVPGEAARGVLPLELGEGINAARARWTFEVRAGTSYTITAHSLDFDPALSVRDEAGRELARDSESGPWHLPRLVLTAERSARLTVEVLAEEARGGEYALQARVGRFGTEGVRESRDVCRAIAERAESRGEPERASRHWLEAARISHAVGDPSAARADLERCGGLADPADALDARLLGALCLSATRDPGRVQAALEALAPELERAAAGRPGPRSDLARAMLHDGLGDARRELVGMAAAAPEYRIAAEAIAESGSVAQQVTAWSKLSFALDETRARAEADEALERCSAAAERSGHPLLRAQALLAHARVAAARGEARAARDSCRRALELERRPAFRAELLGTLATSCTALALYEEAGLRLAELGDVIAEQGLSGLEPAWHRERAVLAWKLGDLAEAERELDLVLAMAQPALAAATRIDRALVLADRGELPAALDELVRAVDLARSTSDATTETLAWLSTARLCWEAGQLERCAEACERVGELAVSAGGEQLGALAESALAFRSFLRGEHATARSHAASAARRLEALEFPEEALDAHDTLARVELAEGDADGLRRRLELARELLARAERGKLGAIERAGRRSRFADWGALAESLATLELAGARNGDEADNQALRRGWEAAGEWKGRVLLEGLAEPVAAAEAASRRSSPAAWLGPRAALLEYSESLDELVLYLVHGGKIERLALERLDAIQPALRRFAALASDRHAAAGELIALGAELHDRLLAPALCRLPPELDTLVIAPTAALSDLPFEALVRDARVGRGAVPGDVRYVIDDFQVCLAPSAGVLEAIAARPPRARGARHLILGDALYGGELSGQDERLASRSLADELARLPRLEYTRGEALGLARRVASGQLAESATLHERIAACDSGRSASLEVPCFELHLGERAARERLWGDLRGFSDLHLALHGRADPLDQRRTGLALAWEPSSAGLLGLEDVLRLRLDADLVVLSACETARGRSLRGEGALSIAYGFLRAGARATVASLWRVDDRDAAEILLDLETLRARLEPPAALREARQAFRRRMALRGEPVRKATDPPPSPWSWAAYVYLGLPPRP